MKNLINKILQYLAIPSTTKIRNNNNSNNKLKNNNFVSNYKKFHRVLALLKFINIF